MSRFQRRRQSAYTLLEIVIVLFIIMLILGMTVGIMRNAFAHEDLKTATRRFSLLAKKARALALRDNRLYEIHVEGNRLTLAAAGSKSAVAVSLQSESGNATAPTPGTSNTTDTDEDLVTEELLPAGVKVLVRPWGEKDWVLASDFVWIFSPAGLCAPHRFRFAQDEAWIEEGYNPLTANLQDEKFYLP